MSLADAGFGEKSRLKALLEDFSAIKDPREEWRVAHPLPEVLLLVVCGTIADGDDYDTIAAWARRTLRSCAVFCPITTACPAAAGSLC